MSQVLKPAKQVLNRIAEAIVLAKSSVAASFKRTNDDTVEAQAQTFRIWMWSSAAGLALIVIASVTSMSSEKKAVAEPPAASSPIEKLPEGFVIVPIEPVNVDSLDSVFEQHGYADLFRDENDEGKVGRKKRGHRIARGVPLIRAPRNPRMFAVIVRETESDLLAELNRPVVVTLRRGPPKTFSRETNDDDAPVAVKRRGRPRRTANESVSIDVISEDSLAISGGT